MSSSPTSVFNNMKIALYCGVCMRTSGENYAYRWSRTCAIGLISSYNIIFEVVHVMLLSHAQECSTKKEVWERRSYTK